MKYEAHITVDPDLATEEHVLAVAGYHDWKFSKILNDPVLGAKAWMYLSAHDTCKKRLLLEMNSVAETMVGVVRKKIEAILHDVRVRP